MEMPGRKIRITGTRGIKMNLEELIGFKIVDVAERFISKRRGLIIKKGDKMFWIEAKDKFEISDVKIRKETGNTKSLENGK